MGSPINSSFIVIRLWHEEIQLMKWLDPQLYSSNLSGSKIDVWNLF